jgi:two-component system chemotaxis sensor kinase CheA
VADASVSGDPEQVLPLDWLAQLPETLRREIVASVNTTGATLQGLVYTPEAACFFSGEDPLHLVSQIPDLQGLLIINPEPWPDLSELDPYQCVVQFCALSTASQDTLVELFRYAVDNVVIGPVDSGFLGDTDTAPATTVVAGTSGAPTEIGIDMGGMDDQFQQGLRRILSEQMQVLDIAAEAAHWAQQTGSVMQVAKNALRCVGYDAMMPVLDQALVETEAQQSPIPLRNILATIDADVAENDAYPNTLSAVDENDACGKTAECPPVQQAAASTQQTPVASQEAKPVDRPVSKTLKIDQERIDQLMDLVGELVVAKNGLPYLAMRAQQHYSNRDLAREIKDQYAVIHRITQSLQESVMQVRMLPVANVFQRFPRLVRDTARKLEKQIELVIEGEDTEADKNIIEVLSEPLIHLVRNSMDHGIESPAERQQAGKTAAGTLRIKASQDNDSVVIEIIDDGKGIDPEVVKMKAYEKGLLDEQRLATISDQEAIQLIFASGLSTATAVSDLSGRGVGMDAVRTSIERVGGTVRLSSEMGRGTTVKVSLPLTMAVTQVMVIESADQLWGIPMNGVVETVRIPSSQCFHIKDKEVFNLRDRIVPLARLRQVLNLPDKDQEPEELPVLVVRMGGAEVGLVVDRFREGMETILRPLEGVLTQLKLYSGSALLGDGTVLLVLNVKELLNAYRM